MYAYFINDIGHDTYWLKTEDVYCTAVLLFTFCFRYLLVTFDEHCLIVVAICFLKHFSGGLSKTINRTKCQ